MVFQNDIIAGASGAGGGYTIDQSILFNVSDSAYMYRTPASTTNQKTWTWSGWVKGYFDRGTGDIVVFGAGNGSGTYTTELRFQVASESLYFFTSGTGGTTTLISSSKYRDPSAWYHIVVAVDTTQATASDRIKIYVNGDRLTAFSTETYQAQNTNTAVNYTNQHNIGKMTYAGYYYPGYQAEINLIDGQQLSPTDFGEYNDDGVWVPKAYAGTYGTNGFYITGADSADLGADYSGNNNDFTSTGLTSDDQRGDTPTLNYPTISPISVWDGPNAILSEGNLRTENNAATTYFGNTLTMQPPQTGKWYFESSIVTAGQFSFGIEATNKDFYTSGSPGQQSTGYAILSNGVGLRATRNNNINTNTRTADTAGDVFQIAMDCDEGEVWLGRNNTWYGGGDPSAGTTPTYTFDAALEYAIVLTSGTNGNGSIRYVQGPDWTYTAPTAFKELNTANLPAPTIADGSAYFQTSLYSGTGSPLEINQTGNSTFQPDMVWAKSRSASQSHRLADAIRGSAVLFPDLTDAEDTTAGISFDADGFSWTNSDGSNANDSGVTYAGWQWLAANGTASNTDGDFTSTVSANQTAGFSVLTWTGDGTSTVVNSIGHGLGKAPSLIIMRRRSPADDWFVYAKPITESYYLRLNSTAAQAIDTGNNTWGGTAPTSSVFYTEAIGSAAYNYVAYCFAEVEGFSKFGKYTGNGSADGPFVWCGFRPAWVMTKKVNSTGNWYMNDSARSPANPTSSFGANLYADLANAESGNGMDILSNGFKIRNTDSSQNTSGGTYIFMAFAEHPFGGDGVAPVPAR